MNHLKLFLVFVFVSSFIMACNTVNGAGEDISAGGKAISHAATDVQKKM